MTASELVGWARTGWRLLVAVDACLVGVFAVTAALDPHQVLEIEGVEIHNFPGLLPSSVVLVLRAAVWVAERRLLAVPRARSVIFAGRLASLIGFYYAGNWLYHQQYGRWQEVVLGGTIGYALVGVAGVGVAALVHGVTGLDAVGRTAAPAATDESAAAATVPATPAPATPGPQVTPAAQRRELTKESLFGLVGVFLGVAGLIMSVTSVARIAVAVAVAAVAVAGIAFLLRVRSR
jgi:hypothetical protein